VITAGLAAGPSLRQPDGDLPFDVLVVEAGDNLKLIELVRAGFMVQVGEPSRAGMNPGDMAIACSKARRASAIRWRSRRQSPRRCYASPVLSPARFGPPRRPPSRGRCPHWANASL
jgi:hypothetical protein